MFTHQMKPRRRYIRLRNYDYSQPGLYFITVCTWERKWMLGDIVNGEMSLNIAGSIAQSLWSALPERFPHVELDQYIIMPNHMHGIVALVKPSSIPLREVVRTFKGATTYRIRAEDKPDFAWQRNYYEHVIRNDEDLDRIRQYIVNNPASWAEDRFFTEAR